MHSVLLIDATKMSVLYWKEKKLCAGNKLFMTFGKLIHQDSL